MDAVAIELRRIADVEFRVEAPAADRLTDKHTGRVLAIKAVFIEVIVADGPEAEVTRNINRKPLVMLGIRRLRIVNCRIVHTWRGRRGLLRPSA